MTGGWGHQNTVSVFSHQRFLNSGISALTLSSPP